MKPTLQAFCFFICLLYTNSLYSQSSNPELKKATTHPIQYYISLPSDWSANTKWPVVIVLEAAEKEYKKNAECFITAGKDMPFIIVAPFITTNGQQGLRDSSIYPYSQATWDTIEKKTTCWFDIEGLQAIISNVKNNYSGSDKVFITGFEAGTHLLWAMIFQHPELLYAAAPVAGNYRGRCMEENLFSADPSRTQLPIRNFTGSEDKDFGVDGRIYSQYTEAKNLALAHGYKNISEIEIKGKGHVPLPENVLEYFRSVWETIKK